MVFDTAKIESPTRPFALLFVLLNILDLVLTYWVLNHGGVEVNPVMRAWMELGIPATVSMKVGSSILLAGLLCRLRQRTALKLGAFFMLCICLFNFAGLASGVA